MYSGSHDFVAADTNGEVANERSVLTVNDDGDSAEETEDDYSSVRRAALDVCVFILNMTCSSRSSSTASTILPLTRLRASVKSEMLIPAPLSAPHRYVVF